LPEKGKEVQRTEEKCILGGRSYLSGVLLIASIYCIYLYIFRFWAISAAHVSYKMNSYKKRVYIFVVVKAR